jgi:hypothetical protein
MGKDLKWAVSGVCNWLGQTWNARLSYIERSASVSMVDAVCKERPYDYVIERYYLLEIEGLKFTSDLPNKRTLLNLNFYSQGIVIPEVLEPQPINLYLDFEIVDNELRAFL